MIVIESGGTKSTWVFRGISESIQSITTVGLHPRELSPSKYKEILKLIQENHFDREDVYFFGAGCESQEAKNDIFQFFKGLSLKIILVETDIYAACIAHLGHKSGAVGILGTGAIAAKFDGENVIKKTSGLGYLIGDEGSGFDIGKRLLQKYFKNQLSDEIKMKVDDYFSPHSILHRIYAEDGRFMVAGLTQLVYEYRNEPIIEQILGDAFSDYCLTALKPLKINRPVHFIGSIAYFFKKELKESLLENGFQLGNIEREAAYLVYKFLSNKKAC